MASDTMDHKSALQMTNIATIGGDSVVVNGSRWQFMVDRDRAWVLAFKNMAPLPKEARCLPAAIVSASRAMLTRSVTPVATIKASDLAVIAMGMQHEEKRCDKVATLAINGTHFTWFGVSVPMTLMRDDESAALSIIQHDGKNVLRFDTATIRFALMSCVPQDGGPCVEVLDEETMGLLQSASKGGAA